ncbi:MAG: cell division protein SepF [Candidatus Caenarcaniphilales bacterium]|nr:cell division protein SepF [Candidatus Caenarcaniphilales bacterium]
MSIVEKIKSFWLGAEDEAYDEGFDDLFRIEGGLGNSSNRSTSLSPETTLSPPPVKTKIKEATTQSTSASANALKAIEQAGYSATNEVIVLEPTSFNQAPEVIQYLRRGSSIVLNLCKLDSEQSQRLIDFICGGIYALDGSQRRVGEGVFLLVPNSVNINSVENKDNKLIHSFWSQRTE